jgi:hypothetical protein
MKGLCRKIFYYYCSFIIGNILHDPEKCCLILVYTVIVNFLCTRAGKYCTDSRETVLSLVNALPAKKVSQRMTGHLHRSNCGKERHPV